MYKCDLCGDNQWESKNYPHVFDFGIVCDDCIQKLASEFTEQIRWKVEQKRMMRGLTDWFKKREKENDKND